LLLQRQLHWLGHVIRMPDNRLPRRLLYGELTVGQRSVVQRSSSTMTLHSNCCTETRTDCPNRSRNAPGHVEKKAVGRPKKCFIDHIKANLLKCNIKPSDLEALASNRDIWRTVCDSGLRSFLTGWITAFEERRAARHAASTKPKTSPRCPQCNRVCASEFRLRSHMWSHVKSGNT